MKRLTISRAYLWTALFLNALWATALLVPLPESLNPAGTSRLVSLLLIGTVIFLMGVFGSLFMPSVRDLGIGLIFCSLCYYCSWSTSGSLIYLPLSLAAIGLTMNTVPLLRSS